MSAPGTTRYIHPFESAGLGIAPFAFVKSYVATYQACPGAPVQPGASCDYCGTGLMQVCEVRSSDGKTFKVGCDCVRKVFLKTTEEDMSFADRKLLHAVKAAQNKMLREARHAREKGKLGQLADLLGQDGVRAKLAAQPHPIEWRAKKGDTRLQWAEWMHARAGTRGRLEVLKFVQGVL